MATADKKTIFMTVYDGMISRAHLRTNVLPMLAAEARVVLFCSPTKTEYYRNEFASASVVIETSPRATYPRLEKFLWIFLFHSIPTLSVKNLTVRNFWERERRGRIYFWFKLLLHRLGRFAIWRKFLRRVYLLLPDHSFDLFFEKYHPALIFAPNMVSDEDMRLLKGAKKRGIKTVGMMKSWDNVNTKAFVSIHPDLFIAQNTIIRDDLINLADYPAEKIVVTGFPQHDQYYNYRAMPKSEFLTSMGLDPHKKTILYAAAGDMLAPKDVEVLDGLVEMVRNGELGAVQILLRPHPKYICHEEKFGGVPFVVIDRPGKYVAKGRLGTWEFEKKDIQHFIDSMVNSDVIVNTASTTCIEAAIFDLPNVSIAFDGASFVPSALSVKRLYEFECIETLMAFGGVAAVSSFDELKVEIKKCLADRSYLREGRKRIFEKECWRIDGRAAERVASAILKELKK